jgi:hypothetical protein
MVTCGILKILLIYISSYSGELWMSATEFNVLQCIFLFEQLLLSLSQADNFARLSCPFGIDCCTTSPNYEPSF